MAEQLINNRTNSTLIQLLRYTFVSGIAFIFDFGLLYILTEFINVYYLVSAAIAFLLGLIINYFLSVTWVFEKRPVKSKWLEFTIFAVIGIVGLALNELFIWGFTDIANLHYLQSKIMSTVFVFLWNFFARKHALFDNLDLNGLFANYFKCTLPNEVGTIFEGDNECLSNKKDPSPRNKNP